MRTRVIDVFEPLAGGETAEQSLADDEIHRRSRRGTLNDQRALRAWLGAGMLVLLPIASLHAQFVTPSAFQRQTRPEASVTPPAMPWHSAEASDTVAERDRSGPSAVSLVAADDGPSSYASYALWGIGIGGGVGFALGAFTESSDDTGCPDCWVSAKAAGAVVGAVLGWVISSIAYFGAQGSGSADG